MRINEFILLSEEEKKNLKELNLYETGSERLTSLNLSRLQALCNSLTQCQNLQHLDLSRHYFDGLDLPHLQVLCTALIQCPNLQHLNLSSNYLDELDLPRLQVLCTALTQCQKLQRLDLRDNYLYKLALPHLQALPRLQVLYTTFIHCQNLQQLDLRDNYFDRLDLSCLQTLLDVIAKCQHLVEFSIEVSDRVINNKINSILKNHQAESHLPKAETRTRGNPASLLFLASKVFANRATANTNILPLELKEPIENYRALLTSISSKQ